MSAEDIAYADITQSTAHDFYQFLRTKNNTKGGRNGHNFSAKVLMFLRSAFDYAFKNGIVDKNVWANVNYGQKHKRSLIYLSKEQLKALCEKEFDILRIQQIADCFIFQSSCGLSYADFANLTQENLKPNPYDGDRIWIYTYRQKTSQQVIAPILPHGLPILEKYGGIDKLPLKTNECYNLYLKEIANVLGFNIKLTTHVARKTFAMLCLNHYNIPIETVSKVLGHRNITTTQNNYARIHEGKIAQDFGGVLKGEL